VRLSANACRVQVNEMCQRMHDQINATNARLIQDVTNSEQVCNVRGSVNSCILCLRIDCMCRVYDFSGSN
jgi:hypothetical protein